MEEEARLLRKKYCVGFLILAIISLTTCSDCTEFSQNSSIGNTTSSSTSFGSDGCTTHIGTYHAIPTEQIEYVIQQRMDEFVEKYGWEEDHNIVNFASFCNISKEDFAEFIDE